MKLTQSELEYIAAWAREEWEPECYQKPAHRLQLSHGVKGAYLIDLIKAWTELENKPDRAILEVANAEPNWPWKSDQEFRSRLQQAQDLGKVAL